MNPQPYIFAKNLLSQLKEEAVRRRDHHCVDAISRLISLFDNFDLYDSDLRLKELISDITDFENGKMDKNHLISHIVWYMESYGSKLRDIAFSEAVQINTRMELDQDNLIFPIDFKEIPSGNQATGRQDEFELFARDFLNALGYFIVQGPGRGPDGGKDLIIVEELKGIEHKKDFRWFVSCKHFAHKGKSVGISDEEDIPGRLDRAECDGFMGFYSYIISSSLSEYFKKLNTRQNNPIPVLVFDHKNIELKLRSDTRLRPVGIQYFPNTYAKRLRTALKNQYEYEVKILEEVTRHRLKQYGARLDTANAQRIITEKDYKLRLLRSKLEYQMQSYNLYDNNGNTQKD